MVGRCKPSTKKGQPSKRPAGTRLASRETVCLIIRFAQHNTELSWVAAHVGRVAAGVRQASLLYYLSGFGGFTLGVLF